MVSTRFTDATAVDAWDQWFRWRNAEGLRDRTIDATWWRVADAIAPVGGHRGAMRRYIEAFSRWQLLPDERLLRHAGTTDELAALDSPSATLNLAAFVIAPSTRHARFDAEGFCRIAMLAVRLLDDALVKMHGSAPNFRDLRIGVIGAADALAALGIAYGHAMAADLMRSVGAALAQGTLRGSVELAKERGATRRYQAHKLTLWRDRGVPEWLIEDARSSGARHGRLSSIERQPRLALLANRTSDALDPRPASGAGSIATGSAQDSGIAAQLALRAAITPWIDAPLDYPLTTLAQPDAHTLVTYWRFAEAYGCDPRFGST